MISIFIMKVIYKGSDDPVHFHILIRCSGSQAITLLFENPQNLHVYAKRQLILNILFDFSFISSIFPTCTVHVEVLLQSDRIYSF